MALLVVLNTDGKPVLVHSSIFDRLVRVRPAPDPWPDVWRRFEDAGRDQGESHGG